MAPETIAHARRKLDICQRLQRAIERADLPCEAFVDGSGVQTDERSVLIPDALVRRGDPLDDAAVLVPDPLIIVEVLSPSTRAIDLTYKLERYFQIPSLVHYLIARSDSPVVLHHRRNDDGISVRIVGPGELLLDPPGITLMLD